MDLSKLTLSDKVILGSGLALLIFSFLPWFGKAGYSRNGWSYFLFGVIPVLLMLAIVALVALTRFGTNTKLPDLPIPWGLALLIAAGLAALLILLKLLFGDDVSGFGGSIDLDRQYGLYISLLAALGLVAGCFLRFQEEGGTTTTSRGGTSGGPTTPF